MKKKKIILLLIFIAFVIFPFDPGTLINRIVGFNNHIILFILLIVVIFFIVDGKNLKDKLSNLKKEIKSNFKK